MTQKKDLLELIQGSSGSDWANFYDGWDESTDECSWHGIECDSSQGVSTINLEGLNLAATIPSSLGRIVSLQHIYLGSNDLYGAVPSELASLPNLSQIDLSSNNLTGNVPNFRSAHLEVINLSHNLFAGTLQENFGAKTGKLKILDLKNNQIEGTLPDAIGKISTLKELDLSDNEFSGPINESLGSLTNLEALFLSNNRLIGTIPPALTREGLSLRQIFLHGNSLSGTLPAALADLPNLQILFIDDNKLTGSVPRELCDLHLNEAFFSDHGGETSESGVAGSNRRDRIGSAEITSPVVGDYVPGGSDGRKLRRQNAAHTPLTTSGIEISRRLGDPSVDRDGCNSIACPAGYYSSRQGGKDGVFPCTPCEEDSYTPYLGATQCFEQSQDKILERFRESIQGPNRLDSSWSDESIPVCEKEGISCNHHNDIIAIRLPNHQLAGTLSENLGFLRHLEVLDLADNQFEGGLPSELHFAPLEELDISGNRLTGQVPLGLCEKSGLNGNGKDGDLNCNVVACAVGTFSHNGRSEAGNEGHKCVHCSTTDTGFLGAKSCSASPLEGDSPQSDDELESVWISYVLFAFLYVVMMTILLLWRKKTKESSPVLTYEIPPPTGTLVASDDGRPSARREPSVTTSPSQEIARDPSQEIGRAPSHEIGRDEWNAERNSSQEFWLDVPKIT